MLLTETEIGDIEFRSLIVAMLNRILLTASELFRLRIQLKNPDENVVFAVKNQHLFLEHRFFVRMSL